MKLAQLDATSSTNRRSDDVAFALLLTYITIGWMTFLIKEAREAIRGESCSVCNDASLHTGIRDEKGGGH